MCSEDHRAGGAHDVERYRRACQEINRLLDEGRLSEARRLNEEVRTLFARLVSAGWLE